ncbi:flagellar filament capping protein FliD [Alphaproteobacteria bacterium]|nr:flagellar filament capping protein FliD [Alphaproteobacteria bacterium]
MAVDYLSAINQSGSGLNITQIVDSLVEAEKTPQTSSIQSKIDDKTTSISAIGEVKSALSVLSSSLSTLVGKTSLAVSSNSTAVTATISDPSTATKLNSAMTVSALATGQTLAFSGYSATTDVVGAGSLVLERGDWSSGSFVANATTASTNLTVASTDTLASLRDKINALNYGVTASIIGSGDDTFNLVLKSNEGKENALRITATENPSGSGLSSIDNSSTNSSKQKIAGVDATIVVDGMTLTRSSNEITDLFEGYTVSLTSTTSTTANLTASVNTAEATSNLQSLVTAINNLKEVLNAKTFRGDSSNDKGELADDAVIKSLKKQIDSLTTSALPGFGSSSVYLSNLGVRTERSGLLSLNTTVLENTLKNNPSSLDAVFNSMYSSGSSLLSVSGGSNSNPTAGTYAYAMTAYVSGAFTGLVSSDTTPGVTSSNNTIKLIIDGTTSGTVTIPSAEYSSESALATAIQTAVNADSALTSAGKSVVVTHSNGSYSITSGSTGSATSVALNAIGSNLDSFLKMSGTADPDAISTSQSGTASSALTLNGASISSGSFTDNAGKRLSITSGSGNESGYTFTVVGTDLSGNAQTEVITGPAANATVIGSKTFKTVTSVTPSSNTTGSITVGTTGAGITTTGVTGSATLDGVSMIADITNNTFTIASGNAAGMKVKYSGLGATGSVFYGQSLLDRLTSYITTSLNSTASGSVTNRISTLSSELTKENNLLADLDTKFESTRSRYIQQFSAMESAVTSLKSTGEYLTNLFESMNQDN